MRSDFVESVRERMPESERRDLPARLATLLTAVRIDPSARAAEIEFAGSAGAERRFVTGASCARLVASVALIAAMALSSNAADPAGGEAVPDAPNAESPGASNTGSPLTSATAATSPPPPTEPEVVAASPTEASPTQPPKTTTEQGDKDERLTGRRDESENSLPRIDPTPGVAVPMSAWAVGLGGRISGWTGPGTPLGLDAMGEFAAPELGWSSRLSLVHTRSTTSSGAREAEFRQYALRAEGCMPVRWTEAPWVLAPCIGVGVGAMHASGLDGPALEQTRDAFGLWLDVALIGRVQTPPLGGLRLEGQLEVGSALVDHRYHFDQPRDTVYRARPGLAPGAHVGVVVPL